MERRCDFFVLSCWPPLQNPRAVELTEAIFFALSTKSWALFFFVFSGEAAKAKGGGAIATNEGQKAEYYAEATADVLRWSGKYAAAEKKVGVFVLLSLLFWPLHMNNDLFQAIEGLFRRSGGAGWQEGFND